MGKNKKIVLGAVLVATLLAGCGDQNAALEQHAEAEVASSPETTEVPAFHFESGTLELGDFDPQTLGDDLFDPCTEISEEEFAAAGITRNIGPARGTKAENGSTGCSVESELPGTSKVILANASSRSWLEREGARSIQEVENSEIPGAFVHFSEISGGRDCYAQVDTVRGGLTVAYSIRGSAHKQLDPCSKALESLEKLYLSLSP